MLCSNIQLIVILFCSCRNLHFKTLCQYLAYIKHFSESNIIQQQKSRDSKIWNAFKHSKCSGDESIKNYAKNNIQL